MINNPSGGDSSSSTIFENLDNPNSNPLEVNQLNPSVIVLSNYYGSGKGYVENGDGPFRTSTKESIDESSKDDEEMNSGNLDMRDAYECLSSFIKAHIDPDVVIAALNERWTHYFARAFEVVHS